MLMAAMASTASAQTLEDFWNLEEPSFNYTDKTFIMTYRFSEGITSTAQTKGKLYLYGDRSDPNSNLNCMQGEEDNDYEGTTLTLTEANFGASGDAVYKTNNKETVNVVLNTATVADDDDIFDDLGAGINIIHFCVRYGLYTEDHTQTSAYEVNFLESLIELTVDLTGDFTVTDIRVAPKDKLKRTANQDYDLEAFQCTGKTVEGGIKDTSNQQFNQGDVITVCVQPDETARGDNIYMKIVNRFEYILLDTDGVTETDTKQLAIEVGNAAATDAAKGTMYGLTNIDNCQGEVACKIETILFATFYTREGIVTGKGTGTMQFGTEGYDGDINNRKLRGAEQQRVLEEDATAPQSEFDVNFSLASNDSFQAASGASTSMTILGLVGAAAGALML